MAKRSKIVAGMKDAVRYSRGDQSRGRASTVRVPHPIDIAPLPAFEPAHPGAIFRDYVLAELFDQGVPLVRVAKQMGVSRQTLYDLINERRAVTADMAVRMGRACGNSTMFWLGLQSQHDAWHAERNKALKKIKRLDFAAA